MSEIGEKLDEVIQLTSEENLAIFGSPKLKVTRFTLNVQEPWKKYHLLTSKLETITIVNVLNEAVQQMNFFLLQFPSHKKPPPHIFEYSLEAFLHRRTADQRAYESYLKSNSTTTLNITKLHGEYKICIPVLLNLIRDLKDTRCFESLKQIVKQMNQLDEFLINLDQDNENNIKLLRELELRYIKLRRIKTKPTKEIKHLDHEYAKVQNEYHDVQLLQARQLRYDKNLINAQMEQIKRRESNKSGTMIDELNELSRLCEQEILVFEESSKFNLMSIAEFKVQVEVMSQKYDDDIITTEFQISRAQSDLNYFEEMWYSKSLELEFMKAECDSYVESVCQRKREVIAKRFAKIWIASARATIVARKRKARRLAKKNKDKKKMK